MDRKARIPRPNPLDKANPVSKLLFSWFWSIFGRNGSLEAEDLWDAPQHDKARHNADLLETEWTKQIGGNARYVRPSDEETESEVFLQANGNVPNQPPPPSTGKGYKLLLRALFSAFGWKYLLVWPLMIFNDCILRVVQPWFMLMLIRTFVEEPVDKTAQYLYATGVCLSTLLLTLAYNPCAFYMGRLGQRCRIALASLIQRKMIRLGAGGLETDQGQIINLLQNDASYIENNVAQLPYILIAPLQLAAFMSFLWAEFGLSSLAGVGFILLYMPFQYVVGNLSTKYRQQIGSKTDERMRVLGELIGAINALKMYAWEMIFKQIVQERRKAEVKQLRKRSRLHAFQMSIFLTSSRAVPFFTFLAFVLSGGPLTADRVFYAIAVYNTATHFMVFMLPGAIRGVGEIRGSLQRIQTYLLLNEKPANSVRYQIESARAEPSVTLEGASASWYPSGNSVLHNISLEAVKGQLIFIVGKVGSGKSSLLHLILNELYISTGHATVEGTLSYSSQTAYIFPGTIRSNILLHNVVDEDRYASVLEATRLADDIRRFRKGDQTKVVLLSGGQKARVNLARALYHVADIYLLDDPLSALDTRVSRDLVTNAFKGFLQGKLRIVATHRLQYLNEADRVIVMDEGRIVAQGRPEEVASVVQARLGDGAHAGDVDSLLPGSMDTGVNQIPNGTSSAVRVDVDHEDDDDEGVDNDREQRAEGSMGLGIYWNYFKSGSSQFQLWMYFAIFIIAQVFTTVIEYWLSLWTNAEEQRFEGAHNQTNTTTVSWNSYDAFVRSLHNLEQDMYRDVYIILTVIIFFTNLAKAVAFFQYCMRICTRIHERMLTSVVRAEPSFFHTNPEGRITNRFAKDMATIDELIPFAFFDMWTIFLQVGTVILLIVIAIWYIWYIALGSVLVFLFMLWYLRRYYVTTSRVLKRIEGTSRSPVITQLQASFAGLVTIRAFNDTAAWSHEFDTLQDDNTSATISSLAASQCFNIWIEVLATILLTVVSFAFLLAQNYLGMTFLGGNVGLAICNAMSLTIWLQYGMKVSANVENLMISVERALEYTKLPAEAELTSKPKLKPPKNWPQYGALNFTNICLSYDRLHDVLRSLTFNVNSLEKVGIVGKTGAGKSSIFWALFRMTELRLGEMVIDGIDVGKLGLHDLRQKITTIPQEPKLFKGSLEFNLDPRVELANGVTEEGRTRMRSILQVIGLRKDLDFMVESNGANLSTGERQLVSLARALILNRRIVCLDEATANIDSATDENIQRTLRRELANCTVITIAHRLGTVIESDRILVMSDGQRVEYAHPHELLQNPNSQLSALVRNTGAEEQSLRERARAAFQAKQKQT